MVYTVWLCILKTPCGVFKFHIFQHFVLVVALRVGEMTEASVQGIFGHYKVVSMFSSLWHVNYVVSIFFFSLCSLPSASSALCQCMCLYLRSFFSVFQLSQKSSSTERAGKPFTWVFQRLLESPEESSLWPSNSFTY